MAVLYNSTEDLETFLRSGCDLNYAGAHRAEIRTDCVSPVFRQLGIPCREEVGRENLMGEGNKQPLLC